MPKGIKIFFAGMLVLGMLLGGAAVAAEDFDEAAWRRKVESARIEDLYAPHFRDGRYFNPWMPMEEKGILRFLKWKLMGRRDHASTAEAPLPAVLPDVLARIKAMPEGDFLMYVGHATFLLRLGGEYWLTDPIFSDRALLPKRLTPPAIHAGDLSGLGASKLNVIISHNHHDHLDRASIEALPDDARFYVPLGLKGFFTGLGKTDVIEMDWWHQADHGNGVRIVCLPMQHWSRRIGQGVNETLWASFLIVTPTVTVYFAGDSGYFIGYQEIGKRYPGIDFVLMPTTAYRPRWFMHYAHMDIDEAVDAFEDLGAHRFIPTQWGVFHLGDDHPGHAVVELRRRIVERKLDASRFLIPDIGSIIPLAPHKKR